MTFSPDENERGDDRDVQRRRQLGVHVGVHLDDTEALLLGHPNPRDEARHASRGTGAAVREEEQHRPVVLITARTVHSPDLPPRRKRKTLEPAWRRERA